MQRRAGVTLTSTTEGDEQESSTSCISGASDGRATPNPDAIIEAEQARIRKQRHLLEGDFQRKDSDLEKSEYVGMEMGDAIELCASTKPKVMLFGVDLSHCNATTQFLICTSGVFSFNVLYGYLQELLSVHVACRKFALFLAVCQFSGYAFWSHILVLVNRRGSETQTSSSVDRELSQSSSPSKLATTSPSKSNSVGKSSNPFGGSGSAIPFVLLAVMRAMDLALTNCAMFYLNYPAKTLIKSSRVVFTMFLGILIQGKRYRFRDYCSVFTLVIGLAIFLHADSTTSAVFHPLGVLLLTISLVCDGTLNNWSEHMMDKHSMSQDEFHAKLYSVSLIATIVAANARNELVEGIEYFLLKPGTVDEIDNGETPTWSANHKTIALLLFSTTGIMGASCLGAITKRFGALTMALTSTARKATTLFLSFGLFNNNCTSEHVLGVTLFLSALVVKALGKATGKGDAISGRRKLETQQTPGEQPEEQTSNMESKSLLSRLRQILPTRRKLNHVPSSVDMEVGLPTY